MARNFEFRKLSVALLDEVVDAIRQNQSIALLGPPYGGKAVFLREIQKTLPPERVISFRFETEVPCRDRNDARRVIQNGIPKSEGLPIPTGEQLTSGIETYINQNASLLPVVVIGVSVDGLAFHLSRELLIEMSALAASGRVVIVVSGEYGLRDLVWGPGAVLNTDRLFMAQGFDRTSFQLVAKTYIDRIRKLDFRIEEDVYDTVWELTDGSDALLACIFWQLLELGLSQSGGVVTSQMIRDIAFGIAVKGGSSGAGAHIFLPTEELLLREPECWRDIVAMARGDLVEIALDAPPGTPEFSGVAIREDSNLRPANQVMARYIEHRYDERHLSELAGRFGNWREAFERLERLGPAAPRPSDVMDRHETLSNIAAFGIYLQTLDGTGELVDEFVRGCHYLLGLREVTFWERSDSQPWKLHRLYSEIVEPVLERTIGDLLPLADIDQGEYSSGNEFDPCCIIWVLDSERDTRKALFVLSDQLCSRQPIGTERRMLAELLLRHFQTAYAKWTGIERDRTIELIQKVYAKAIRGLLAQFDANGLSVKDILACSAQGLRALAYRRVLFSLVDFKPQQSVLRALYEECDKDTVRIQSVSTWPLGVPARDLQQWVIETGKWVRVLDPEKEALANQQVMRVAGIRSLTIVPILLQTANGEVPVGTIHVERVDGLVLSLEETRQLEEFGRQLGSILQLAERLSQVESAMHELEDAVVITDAQLRPRFVNARAEELFHTPRGWHPRKSQAPIDHLIPGLTAAGFGARRIARWKREDPAGADEDCFRVLTNSLRDLSGEMTGALAVVRHPQIRPSLLSALVRLVWATNTIELFETILFCCKTVGLRWAKIWVVGADNRTELKFFRGFGFPDARATAMTHRVSRGFATWASLDRREIVVFRYIPGGVTGEAGMSATGIPQVASGSPCPEAEKCADTLWLDLPILDNLNTPVAKLSAQWDEEAEFEQYEFMKAVRRIIPGLAVWANDDSAVSRGLQPS
jgi:PAS domain-containing protein